MRVYTFQTNEKRKRHSWFSVKNTNNAIKLAYLCERLFFLISARQGVTITELCESG